MEIAAKYYNEISLHTLFTPTVMAKIKKTDNIKCWQEYGTTRPVDI